MGDFTMPSLGADMEAGTVVKWLVAPGDEVHRGDIVAVVETEKSTIEVEIFENGVVDELLVPEGERVPVGAVLARVSAAPRSKAAGEPPAQAAPPAQPAPAASSLAPPGGGPAVHSPVVRHLAAELGVDLASVPGSGPGGLVTRSDVERAGLALREGEPQAAAVPGGAAVGGRAPRSSPLARRLAKELGVDLSGVEGSGPGRAVVERDVRGLAPPEPTEEPRAEDGLRAGPASTAGTSPVGADRQAALRGAIASLMARSKREIPHYYLSTTIDVTAAQGWLAESNLDRPATERLVLAALLLKATALAVKKVPELNGFHSGGAFVPSASVHVGVAVSLRSGGVVAPAVHDADRLGLDEMTAALRDLVARARRGVLRASEMSDPTITVSNLGELGVEAVFGVIYPPQVALVGFGQVTERAVARGGMLAARPCLTGTLSADHRVSDGHRGALFLSEIARLLEDPALL